MRRNCYLNLRMLPYNASSSSSSILTDQLGSCSDHNQIKIFYNDATELKAICMLWIARRKMEENSKKIVNHLLLPSLQLRGQGNRGLSLKKSLKKFLQRRKERLQASTPY